MMRKTKIAIHLGIMCYLIETPRTRKGTLRFCVVDQRGLTDSKLYRIFSPLLVTLHIKNKAPIAEDTT